MDYGQIQCELPLLYADDTQVYVSFKVHDSSQLLHATWRLEKCITEVKEWLNDNSLKLNIVRKQNS